jgi:hypothetical protein
MTWALVFSTDQLSHDKPTINDKSGDCVDWKRLQTLSMTRKMGLIAVDFVAVSDLVVVEWIFIGCTACQRIRRDYLIHLNFVIPPSHPPCLRPPSLPRPPSTPL